MRKNPVIHGTSRIPVVYVDGNGKVFRSALWDFQVFRNANGQIILPDGFSSKGYYERISDGVWADLPILESTDFPPIWKQKRFLRAEHDVRTMRKRPTLKIVDLCGRV